MSLYLKSDGHAETVPIHSLQPHKNGYEADRWENALFDESDDTDPDAHSFQDDELVQMLWHCVPRLVDDVAQDPRLQFKFSNSALTRKYDALRIACLG